MYVRDTPDCQLLLNIKFLKTAAKVRKIWLSEKNTKQMRNSAHFLLDTNNLE